jgi:hypothetical protein
MTSGRKRYGGGGGREQHVVLTSADSRGVVSLRQPATPRSERYAIGRSLRASDAMRMLQRGGNPTQLGDALAHLGRIFKTLHVWPTWTGNRTGETSSGCATCK